MAELRQLVVEHSLVAALIIDDGYDKIPHAEDVVVEDRDLLIERLAGLGAPVDERLDAAMAEAQFGAGDYERAIENDAVIGVLWELDSEELLPEELSQQLFEAFKGEQAAKEKQLGTLEEFLNGLGIRYVTEGRAHGALDGAKLVFLDLYLGVTSEASALRQAKERIQHLVKGLAEVNRPVVIVMSTMTGAELQKLAHNLQSDAGLLGCKFRVVSKPEFEAVLEPTLREILDDTADAVSISRWIDIWDAALEQARHRFVNDVRMLDLSDYAYLKKYRLEAEGMGLGSYLVPLLLDYLSYCTEAGKGLADAAATMNSMDLSPRRRHLMPSSQTTVFGHARSFLNEAYIEAEGTQFDDPVRALELGDVIVRIKFEAGVAPNLDGCSAMVVLSQACDTQQEKTDSFLLLRGTIRSRDWLANIVSTSLRTDVFIWREVQYTIDWEKSKSTAVSFGVAKGWLKKGGSHRRIARFRNVEALRLQQVFASNLTRVGTLVSPTSPTPVEFRLLARSAENGGHEELVAVSAASRMVALMMSRELAEPKATGETGGDKKVTKRSSEVSKLIFSNNFSQEFQRQLEGRDLAFVDRNIRHVFNGLKEATADFAAFDLPVRTGDKIELGGQKIPIVIKGREPQQLPPIYIRIDAPADHHVLLSSRAA